MKIGLTIMPLWITLNLYYITSYHQQYQHCDHANLCSKSDSSVAKSRLNHVSEISGLWIYRIYATLKTHFSGCQIIIWQKHKIRVHKGILISP